MEPFVEIIIKEYHDLNDKIKNLLSFILSEKCKGLPQEEQDDLSEQFHAMSCYRYILSRRLKRQGYNVEDGQEE